MSCAVSPGLAMNRFGLREITDFRLDRPNLREGYERRNFTSDPLYSLGKPVQVAKIPREEWRERIADMNARELFPIHRLKRAGYKTKNQRGTNYCWAFGTVTAFEAAQLRQGREYVPLSPASVAGPITGYKNVGGWSGPVARYLKSHGACPSSLWSDTAIDPKLDTPESRIAREDHRVREWQESDDWDLCVSALLGGDAASVAYDWWWHIVCAVGLNYVGESLKLAILNSWGESWESGGYGYLSGAKMIPSYVLVPVVAHG